jgi:hypothetical protein
MFAMSIFTAVSVFIIARRIRLISLIVLIFSSKDKVINFMGGKSSETNITSCINGTNYLDLGIIPKNYELSDTSKIISNFVPNDAMNLEVTSPNIEGNDLEMNSFAEIVEISSLENPIKTHVSNEKNNEEYQCLASVEYYSTYDHLYCYATQ